MKSAPFVSPNFLERVAEPESPFHLDYLAYRRGEITRAELINRLPHVAMLGDSVCVGIYISWPWSTLWRARTSRGKNWFLHLNAAPNILQYFEKPGDNHAFCRDRMRGSGCACGS